jgi:hypothetical protein
VAAPAAALEGRFSGEKGLEVSLSGVARPHAGERFGDRIRLHRHVLRLDGRSYTVITPRPATDVRFSTNRFHDTWHVLSDLRGARLLGRLLWGLAYQRAQRTLVFIGPPFLDPNPFDAEPADPIALVPAWLTSLSPLAARQLRRRPLGMPAGTVRWQTPGLDAALATDRYLRSLPLAQRPMPWYCLGDYRHQIGRIGGVLVLAATAAELRSWAVWVSQLGTWLRAGMEYTELGYPDGEVQVFANYRQRVSAARAARREVLADPATPAEPAEQRPLIWERGATILARRSRGSGRHVASGARA